MKRKFTKEEKPQIIKEAPKQGSALTLERHLMFPGLCRFLGNTWCFFYK